MKKQQAAPDETRRAERFFDFLRILIRALAVFAGAAVLVMIGVTVADIILRQFQKSIPGAYDVVRIAGLVSVSCALPYLTAVKGHIAVEFFYQQFSRTGRVVLDSFFRLIALSLFGVLALKSSEYGMSLLTSGQVMPTLKVPVFWMPFLISLNFGLMFLVTFYHLLHPGKEMLKP